METNQDRLLGPLDEKDLMGFGIPVVAIGYLVVLLILVSFGHLRTLK